MKTGTLAALVAAAGLTLGVGVQMLNAQSARSYTWYAELAGVDQSAKTLTVKVQIRDGVTRYVGTYKPGDKLMLTWVPIQGEADTVIYAPKYEVMKGIDEGFILPVEFVAADAASHSMTVRTAAAAPILQSLQTVQAGRWIKVVTPMKQAADTAALTSAAAAEKPNLKPPPPPPPPPAAEPTGRGRGGRGGSASGGTPLDGTWTVNSQIAGNAIAADCTFAVQGTAVSGSCASQLGQAPLKGELTGNAVKFSYQVEVGGMSLTFDYSGTFEGTAMKGTVSVFGMPGDFTATKK